MATFFGALFGVTGLLLVVSAPTLVLARRRGRDALAIKFIGAAVAIGLFSALGAVGSKRLVDNCRDSGSISCLDVGYSGFLLLVVLVFVITSVSAAFKLYRD